VSRFGFEVDVGSGCLEAECSLPTSDVIVGTRGDDADFMDTRYKIRSQTEERSPHHNRLQFLVVGDFCVGFALICIFE